MELTEGVTTRIRSCLGKLEKSTIYFYVVCERVVPFVMSMKIDSDNKHSLINFHALKYNEKATASDRKPLVMEVKLAVPPIQK